MRRLILVAMIAGLLAPAGLYAQEVYVEGGKVILDLTVEAGMPKGAITSKSKTEFYNSYLPEDNTIGQIGTEDNNQKHSLNATVYQKLEIAPHDMSKERQIESGTGDKFKMDWVAAFKLCRDAEYNGNSDWRLPTQRELYLMYIFKDMLNEVIEEGELGGTVFGSSSTTYWSATEFYASASWVVNFTNGSTVNLNYEKSGSFAARCVREL